MSYICTIASVLGHHVRVRLCLPPCACACVAAKTLWRSRSFYGLSSGLVVKIQGLRPSCSRRFTHGDQRTFTVAIVLCCLCRPLRRISWLLKNSSRLLYSSSLIIGVSPSAHSNFSCWVKRVGIEVVTGIIIHPGCCGDILRRKDCNSEEASWTCQDLSWIPHHLVSSSGHHVYGFLAFLRSMQILETHRFADILTGTAALSV